MQAQLARATPVSSAPVFAAPTVRALLDGARTGHPHLVVRGAAGSGKSALLALVRERIPGPVSLGVTAGAAPEAGSAVLVDDAHLLTSGDLAVLTALTARTDLTIVVATEPRPGNADLRALTAALDGTVTLGNHTARDIARRAEQVLGEAITKQLTSLVLRLSGGVPRCVDAALTALRGAPPSAERAVTAAVAACHAEVLSSMDPELLCALAIATAGAGLDGVELTRVLGLAGDGGPDLVDRARGCGLLQHPDALLASAVEPLRVLLGGPRVAALHLASMRARRDLGTLDLASARAYAAAGVNDTGLADYLVAQAELAEPALAAALYGDAARAGADGDTFTVRRAEAAALAGDLDTAARLTDGLLERAATIPGPDLAATVRIAASVAAHQGMLVRSADLYEWLGSQRTGADGPVAESVLLAAGRPAAAAAATGTTTDAPPTSSTAAESLLAQGFRQSLTEPAPIVLNSMARGVALSGNGSRSRITPDSGAAMAALAAIHCGELDRAQSVLTRAVDDPAAVPVIRDRHLLLTAWVSMVRGDLDAAARTVDALADPLRPRDALFAAALRVGVARRTGDIGSLRQSWDGAQTVIAEHSVDLLSLLPLGELWLGAARLQETDRVAHLVDQARLLLDQLGEPVLWGTPLHWYGVQAAILTETPADLVPHAHALGVAAESSSYAAGLARAGRAWLRVLQGDADVSEVERAAVELGAIGLSWDGARLASEAALRVDDTATATTLLQVARSLRPGPVSGERAPTTEHVVGGTLTDREADVARLLVTGLTYRDIGGRLFISAKTVEHHVARIRRRIGAQSRAEMFSMLRAMGHGA